MIRTIFGYSTTPRSCFIESLSAVPEIYQPIVLSFIFLRTSYAFQAKGHVGEYFFLYDRKFCLCL